MENQRSLKKINLIPADLAVSPKTVKFTKTLSKISTISSVALFITLATVISIFTYFKLEINKVSQNIESLKTEISALEASEQKLVIAKDRLNKIGLINSSPSIKDDLNNFKDVQNLISNTADSSLIEASIQNTKTEFSIESKNSVSLANLLSPITKLKNYKSLILTTLGYSSTAGFISDFIVNKN